MSSITAERLNRLLACRTMDLESFIEAVKKKPELRGVSSEFVASLIKSKLKKSPLPQSERDIRLFLKEVRAELRMHTGRFHQKRPSSSFPDLVSAHTSTRERQPHYETLRNLIDQLHPQSILDIGCGLNPLVLAKKNQVYYACDIHASEIDTINAHFKENAISGRAFVADARTYTAFPKTDVCLILKLLDILDTKGHPNAESLIKRVPATSLIVSFPTRKLSGKRMHKPRRRWFERMLTRLNYSYKITETDNEFFYTVIKS